MRILLTTAVLLLAGCEGFDPAGAYEGQLHRSGEVSRMLTDLAPDGTSTANTSRFDGAQAGTRAVVTRVDEQHLEIQLGECRVLLDQAPEPNDHHVEVALAPPQRCRLARDGFDGEVTMMGTGSFEPSDRPRLTLTMNGSAQSGDPSRAGYTHVQLVYGFSGQRSQ